MHMYYIIYVIIILYIDVYVNMILIYIYIEYHIYISNYVLLQYSRFGMGCEFRSWNFESCRHRSLFRPFCQNGLIRSARSWNNFQLPNSQAIPNRLYYTIYFTVYWYMIHIMLYYIFDIIQRMWWPRKGRVVRNLSEYWYLLHIDIYYVLLYTTYWYCVTYLTQRTWWPSKGRVVGNLQER